MGSLPVVSGKNIWFFWLQKAVFKMKMCILQIVIKIVNLSVYGFWFVQANRAAINMGKMGSATSAELEDVRALYRREALQRKLLYNQASS